MTTTQMPARRAMSPLMIRILSATVFIAIVLAALYAGTYGVYALAVVLAAVALWEFRGLSDAMGSRAPWWLLFPLGLFFVLSGTVLKTVDVALWEFRGLSDAMGSRAPWWLLFPLGLFFVLSGTVLKTVDVALVLSVALVVGLGAFLVVPGRRQGLSRWAMGMAGALYIGMPFNYYLLLYTSKPHGLIWTAFVIFAVIASDAAALLVGSRIGRHPFFSAISPRKTVEGAIAGLVAATVVMVIGVTVVLGISPLHGLVLGVLVGFSAEMGDLVESQMKRLAEVKDSSHLIPGHGGLLDRLDSILFPPILVYLYVSALGLLAR